MQVQVIAASRTPNARVTLCHRTSDGSLTPNFVTVYHFFSCDNARRTRLRQPFLSIFAL
jgi:hypothetical protein